MNRARTSLSAVTAGILASALTMAVPLASWADAPRDGAAKGRGRLFNGFNDHFNLGQSAISGNVCDARRDFDDPLSGAATRVWTVTCRGWSGVQGRLYLFTGAGARGAESAWRASLASKSGCDFSAAAPASPLTGAVACKSRTGGPDQLAVSRKVAGVRIGVIGKPAIADSLGTGLAFMSRGAPEPAAVSESTALARVAGGGDLNLDNDVATNLGRKKDEAYERNIAWEFGDAEKAFSDLALTAAIGSGSDHAEALYNLALNVSNRALNTADTDDFSQADAYFAQADDLVKHTRVATDLPALALNYKAIHARNQGHYEEAIRLARLAIQTRGETPATKAAAADANGIAIAEVGANDDFTVRLTLEEKQALRDVQALEVIASSLEAQGDRAGARDVLAKAKTQLGNPIRGKIPLGAASPWLDMRVRADLMRLEIGTDQAAAARADFRAGLAAFGAKYPDSLPRAGFLMELARAEAAATPRDRALEDQALADYEAAFNIFRERRGSLQASSDLAQPYFDILLSRIGDAKSTEAVEATRRFFKASQILIAQSSADAAVRQAARLASDPKTAGVARSLDDTVRQIEATNANILNLQQIGAAQGSVKAQIDADQATLKQLAAQRRVLEDQLESANPRYRSALREEEGLEDVQAALNPGEVYIKAFLLADHGYGILLTKGAPAIPYKIALSRQAGGDLVEKLREPIDNLEQSPGRFDVKLAHEAFVDLFGPVREQVLSATHVIYEPDANLIGAPISALVVDDSDEIMRRNRAAANAARPRRAPTYVGVAWLGGRVATSTSLSASAFVQVRGLRRSMASHPIFGFGDPIITNDSRAFASVRAPDFAPSSAQSVCADERARLMELPRLPETAIEVTTVSKSIEGAAATSYKLGAEFTDADILSQSQSGALKSYRVLYFATHGIQRPANDECLQSALVTSVGAGGGDGLLDLKKIPELNLDADMVVLSACDTGRNENGNQGEALGGLVSTFVQAGARNLVVSNWPVDSAATAALMTAMFNQKSETQANALAFAERQLMASAEYSHPYFWASFMVVGDGWKPMPGG
jgi:CHAT domain-containing protein